jgi:hypothetical protein
VYHSKSPSLLSEPSAEETVETQLRFETPSVDTMGEVKDALPANVLVVLSEDDFKLDPSEYFRYPLPRKGANG